VKTPWNPRSIEEKPRQKVPLRRRPEKRPTGRLDNALR
jgi:hypothetical protein